MKLLDQLDGEYRRTIRATGTENEDTIKKIEAAVRDNIRMQYVKEINERLEDLGLVVTGFNTSNYDSTTREYLLSFDVDGRVTETLIKEKMASLREEKRKQCEIMKAKYMELDNWRVNCIKEGTILPFDIPILPPVDNGIRCA